MSTPSLDQTRGPASPLPGTGDHGSGRFSRGNIGPAVGDSAGVATLGNRTNVLDSEKAPLSSPRINVLPGNRGAAEKLAAARRQNPIEPATAKLSRQTANEAISASPKTSFRATPKSRKSNLSIRLRTDAERTQGELPKELAKAPTTPSQSTKDSEKGKGVLVPAAVKAPVTINEVKVLDDKENIGFFASVSKKVSGWFDSFIDFYLKLCDLSKDKAITAK